MGLVCDHRVVNEGRQFIKLCGAAEDIDVGISVKKFRAFALGHAADHADHQMRLGFFSIAQLAQSRPHFLLGVLAHRAGVVNNHISEIAIINRFITLRAKLPEHEFAVEHVHLTAKSFHVQLALHARHHNGEADDSRQAQHDAVSPIYLQFPGQLIHFCVGGNRGKENHVESFID